jgi:hypothetical protein
MNTLFALVVVRNYVSVTNEAVKEGKPAEVRAKRAVVAYTIRSLKLRIWSLFFS